MEMRVNVVTVKTVAAAAILSSLMGLGVAGAQTKPKTTPDEQPWDPKTVQPAKPKEPEPARPQPKVKEPPKENGKAKAPDKATDKAPAKATEKKVVADTPDAQSPGNAGAGNTGAGKTSGAAAQKPVTPASSTTPPAEADPRLRQPARPAAPESARPEPTPASAATRQATSRGAATSAAASRARVTPPRPRVFVSGNISFQSADQSFDDRRTFPLNGEEAEFTSRYAVNSKMIPDIGGGVRIAGPLGVGVAVTSFKDTGDITIDGRLPHPLYFSQPRAFEGTASGERKETAVHLQAFVLLPVNEKLTVMVFGGPSFFTVDQSVVSGIDYSESYPYDSVTFTGADVGVESEKATGFNVGADVAYFFNDTIGVGGIIRFARASVTTLIGDIDAGGAMIGGGVRLRFGAPKRPVAPVPTPPPPPAPAPRPRD